MATHRVDRKIHCKSKMPQKNFGLLCMASTIALLHFAIAISPADEESMVKRQTIPLPSKINIGVRTEIDDSNYWQAWTNGIDPCHSTSGNIAPASDNPCGVRFQVPEFDQQLTFNGCGGDDLWLTENGIERVATCYSSTGNVGCATANPLFKGMFQCAPDF
ncbi:hypothetical protein FH972_025483 [Carpinus fangiana]|uniref:Uncharacterized protein n=1 Tax=Carpinus fangiana TaxID=176857 RepID=A0A5N6L197_9ROSI|nr:hypothetical protein FH972_025483 [Carpinus fangiana]